MRMPSRLGAALLAAAALLASTGSAAARTSFDYPDFLSVSGLTVSGSAAQVGDVLRLTGVDTGAQGYGSAFSNTSFDPSRQFHTTYTVLPHGGELSRAYLSFRWERGDAGLWVLALIEPPGSSTPEVLVLLNRASGQQEGFFRAPIPEWRFGQQLRLFVDWWPQTRTLQVSDAFRVPLLTLPLDVAGGLGGLARPGMFASFEAADQDVLTWRADDDRRDRTVVAVTTSPESSGSDEPVDVRANVEDADADGRVPA